MLRSTEGVYGVIPALPGTFVLDKLKPAGRSERVIGVAKHPVLAWIVTELRCLPVTFTGVEEFLAVLLPNGMVIDYCNIWESYEGFEDEMVRTQWKGEWPS